MTLSPFGMVERAVKQLIIAKMPDAEGNIGGDLSFDAAEDDFYVFIALVPGGGNGLTEGEWAVDIDVFDQNYTQAMRRALALEALLIKPGGHRTAEMILDFGTQNEYPAERPWDDESSARIGATYVFSARRTAAPQILPEPPADGSVVHEGDGPPPAELEADPGDFYLDNLTGDLYEMG